MNAAAPLPFPPSRDTARTAPQQASHLPTSPRARRKLLAALCVAELLLSLSLRA